MNQSPPKWMIRCLEKVCPAHLLDEVEGDFYEYYYYLNKRKSKNYANKKALEFIVRSVPRLLLNRKLKNTNNMDILKNYIVIAFRNIKRQLGYSLINVMGLAIGLACCMLIGVYVLKELSYDKFHKDAERTFRINPTYSFADQSRKMFMTPTALLPNLKREFTEVEEGVRVFNVGEFSPKVVQRENVKYQEERFFYVDSTFFDVFSFELIKGNPQKALVDPRSIVVTEETANRYFGDEDAIGQIVKVDGNDYTITGVTANVPENSHLKYDFLASFSSLSISKQEIWGSANYATYIRLNNASSAVALENDMARMVKEKVGDGFGNIKMEFELMPITDIHLRSDVPNEMQAQSDIRYIYIISIVGLLILIIACINYMNLATARSAERAKEVGMRKVLGAVRKQLFYQFIGESAIVTILSMFIALVLVNLALGPFSQLTGKVFTIADVFSGTMLIGLLAIFLVVSFLAGAYPAMSLSSFMPSHVLKGKFSRSKSGRLMRQSLVVLQFSISIFLIIGTLVIYQQLSFMRDKKLGYSKENVIILPTDRNVLENYSTIKTELERRDDVLAVTAASESPVDIGAGYSIAIPGVVDEAVNVNAITVEKDFIKSMQMEVVMGRDYSEADQLLATKDSNEEKIHNFIINERLLNQFMMDESEIIGMPANLNGRKGEIIGVVKDFHFTSLHRPISPLVMFIEPWQFNKLFIRVKSDNIQKTLMAVEDSWKTIVPDRPFVFQFMNEEYDAMYRNEMRLGNVFTVFAVLAIIIACLGLFGLVSFAVQQRNKEIGIRKALGASSKGLFLLISKDFSKLVLISFVVAAPLGYYLMSQWLTDFEYRIAIGVLPFLIAVLCAFIVAFLTVSYQSVKATRVNPAETLRAE